MIFLDKIFGSILNKSYLLYYYDVSQTIINKQMIFYYKILDLGEGETNETSDK